MNMITELGELEASGSIIYKCLAGSHAYGTSIPTSDLDYRGIFINPSWSYLGLNEPPQQISNIKQDITYYSLKRFFELASNCNPNIIELLFMPDDVVEICNDVMKKLLERREAFLSKKAFHSFSGYAYSQINKAKGQNKRVNNPKPKEPPKKENYCYIIQDGEFPKRPKKVLDSNVNLDFYHAAQLEHTNNIFRLYYYGKNAKGVFRGDDTVVCEPIPKDDEFSRLTYLMIYSQSEYERDLKEWNQYWEWKNNRNEARWIDQEKMDVVVRYDQKNMAHCVRLLLSTESILNENGPIVRLSGENLEYVKAVRAGQFKYEDIMADVENRMERLAALYDSSKLQHTIDYQEVEKLYRELT
jgi:hypothetical protein